MPSDPSNELSTMSVQQFTAFEPYCDTISNVDMRMRVLGFEHARYSIAQARVGQLQMQWAQEGSGQLSEGATARSGIGLYMQLDPRPMHVNGMLLDPTSVVFFPPGSEFCFACKHANSWFSVMVPLDVLGIEDDDEESEMFDCVTVVRPTLDVAQRLRTIVPAYLGTVDKTPDLMRAAAASERFQNEVIQIARQVVSPSPAAPAESIRIFSSTRKKHERIATMAAGIVEESLDGVPSVGGIAQLLDVSERTLLTAFQSRFGMTLRQFIQAMRMNRARKLLGQTADPSIRVSDIAAACGYWDFGRFATKYQRLFGELPSQTLRG